MPSKGFSKLVFNGLSFSDIALDHPDQGDHGFFERHANGVYLFDRKRELRAYLVANPRQGYFPVTASDSPAGRLHMFATSSTDEAWLSLQDLSYADTRRAVLELRYVAAALAA